MRTEASPAGSASRGATARALAAHGQHSATHRNNVLGGETPAAAHAASRANPSSMDAAGDLLSVVVNCSVAGWPAGVSGTMTLISMPLRASKM